MVEDCPAASKPIAQIIIAAKPNLQPKNTPPPYRSAWNVSLLFWKFYSRILLYNFQILALTIFLFVSFLTLKTSVPIVKLLLSQISYWKECQFKYWIQLDKLKWSLLTTSAFVFWNNPYAKTAMTNKLIKNDINNAIAASEKKYLFASRTFFGSLRLISRLWNTHN